MDVLLEGLIAIECLVTVGILALITDVAIQRPTVSRHQIQVLEPVTQRAAQVLGTGLISVHRCYEHEAVCHHEARIRLVNPVVVLPECVVGDSTSTVSDTRYLARSVSHAQGPPSPPTAPNT